ncbi:MULTISPECIES: protein kinase family protein [Frankia]|uniref:protein kinase family protein n=1 Tax=Frankia TaxID=1854 RepID=UPI0003079721|nr:MULTISPECIES: protein kinase family protein [Frankia]
MVDGSNRPQAEDVDDVTLTAADARSSATPAGTTVLAETVLDRRYRLLSALTSRGPVTLWRGDDNVLARPVAVRIVEHGPTSPGDNGAAADPNREQAARRLLAAAINSGRLVHPGAASTYDATTTTTGSRRISYVVSEWVDGRTLRQLTAQGALRPEQAGAVVLAAARVIAAAHERGIHHGDLNPGDVIVSSHGTVKIIDLEIGGVLAELERSATPAELDGPDRAGTGDDGEDAEATRVVGTAAGDDAAADLRALGGLLYAGLTGHWPLGGDRGLPTAPTSGGRLRTPRQVTSSVPRDLDAITMATLGDERAGTPIATAAELVDELESINPVDAVLDTGLMSLGEYAASTEAMDVNRLDSTDYGTTADYGASADYGATADYPAPGRYADTGGYPAGAQEGRNARYGPQAGGAGRGGGFDTRGGYDDRDRDSRGYPEGRAGYPPSDRRPSDRRPSGPGRERGQERSSWGRMVPWIALVVVAVVAVVAVIVSQSGGHGGGASPTATAPAQALPSGTVLRPVRVNSFDPPADNGDGSERDSEVGNVVDGNPSTVWHTEGYTTSNFGGLKSGVGLQLNFDKPISPTSVTVQVAGGPVSFDLRSAASPADSIEGYQTVVSKAGAVGPVSLAMPSDLTQAQYWVLWVTSLPRISPTPADGKPYRGAIAEVTFRY